MCTNYRPATRELAAQMFAFPAPAFDYPEEAYPGYVAPAVRRSSLGRYECMAGRFGLIPYWAKDTSFGRRTYNARSETVAGKPAFRDAWQRGRRALVPMSRFYEPDWQSGRAVRWRIERRDAAPFAVAAIWDRWVDRPTGEVVESFSLLTINADGHPVMGRFHRPGDEKRSLVPIEPGLWGEWLDADPDGAMRLLQPMTPEWFVCAPDPRPPTATAAATPAATRQTRRMDEAADMTDRAVTDDTARQAPAKAQPAVQLSLVLDPAESAT